MAKKQENNEIEEHSRHILPVNVVYETTDSREISWRLLECPRLKNNFVWQHFVYGPNKSNKRWYNMSILPREVLLNYAKEN